jgi:hypothetical protein
MFLRIFYSINPERKCKFKLILYINMQHADMVHPQLQMVETTSTDGANILKKKSQTAIKG